MTEDYIDLSGCHKIPDTDLILPDKNILSVLLGKSWIKEISEPINFEKGIILSTKFRGEQDFIIFINTEEGFDKLKKIFLPNTVNWYILIV